MQSQKTVADIWNEVRDEQRRFNKVLRYLFAALIAAFLIAAVAAYLSWTSLNKMSLAVQNRVDQAAAEMDISASETKRRSEELRGETIRIREQIEDQKRYVDMEKRVDRALALSSPERTEGTIDSLAREAVRFAEMAAKGSQLNDATAYLVTTFSDEARRTDDTAISALFSDDEKRLLEVVVSDWKSTGAAETRQQWKRLASDGAARQTRGFGFAGLGLAQYLEAGKPENSLGWDKGCKEAVENIKSANELGVSSGPLLLAQGECLRKNGDKVSAFKAFLGALELQAQARPADAKILAEATLPSINERRRAAHGAGTTLIAIQAAAGSDPVIQAQLSDFLLSLSGLQLEQRATPEHRSACPQAIRDDQAALLHACLLLEHAADLRTERGEGVISRIYTRENIGFIHLLNQDWARAEAHAREIDDELTSAWNLTVLILALDKLALEAKNSGELQDAARFSSDADFFRNKMTYLSMADLDEAEIRKLLHTEFGPEIDTLKLSMKPE